MNSIWCSQTGVLWIKDKEELDAVVTPQLGSAAGWLPKGTVGQIKPPSWQPTQRLQTPLTKYQPQYSWKDGKTPEELRNGDLNTMVPLKLTGNIMNPYPRKIYGRKDSRIHQCTHYGWEAAVWHSHKNPQVPYTLLARRTLKRTLLGPASFW